MPFILVVQDLTVQFHVEILHRQDRKNAGFDFPLYGKFREKGDSGVLF